jgi:hypothetical protein
MSWRLSSVRWYYALAPSWLTFPDSRLDLFNRRLKAQSARLKSRAVELLPKGLRTPAGGGILILDDEPGDDGAENRGRRGDKYRRDVEREVERIKVKASVAQGVGKTVCLGEAACGEGDTPVEPVAFRPDRPDEGESL